MKKPIKKLLPLLVTVGTLTGCSSYRSDPDTKENIIGLYELSVYKSKYNQSDEDTYDRKAEEGIVAYFTVDSDGYGYYGYKDNNTPAFVESVFSTFTADEKEGYYKGIELSDGVSHKYYWEKKVGCMDEPPMGFQTRKTQIVEQIVSYLPFTKKVEKEERTLSYTLHHEIYSLYNPPKEVKYQYVCYKKIGNETGYQKINELLGTSYTPNKPFEMKANNGYFVYRCSPKDWQSLDNKGLYEYAILDMDSYTNGKLTVHYSLKSESVRKSMEIPVEIVEKGASFKVRFNEKDFYCFGSPSGLASGLSTTSDEYTEEDLLTGESFGVFYSSDLTLEQIIE